MWLRLAADALVLLHLLFILFVLAGGLLVLRWPRLALLHVPAAAWGAAVELLHLYCPLTPQLQIWLGGGVLLVNGIIYAWLLARLSRR